MMGSGHLHCVALLLLLLLPSPLKLFFMKINSLKADGCRMVVGNEAWMHTFVPLGRNSHLLIAQHVKTCIYQC